MSKISFENLDKWLFNLQEGNLTPAERRELQNFLEEHPELQEEVQAWQMAQVNAPLQSYAFEAELHAVAGNSVMNYRNIAAAASLLILMGAGSYFLFASDETIEFNFPQFSNNNVNNSNIDITNTSENLNNHNTVNPFETDENFSNQLSHTSANESSYGVLTAEYLTHTSSKAENNFSVTNDFSNSSFHSAATAMTDENSIQSVRNRRDPVSVNIRNEVRINVEHTTEIVYENNNSENLNTTTDELAEIENNGVKDFKLRLKINKNHLIVSDNKAKRGRTVKRRRKNSLNPNPTFTNMRDPLLLTTNNDLIQTHNSFAGNVIAPRFSLNYRNTWTNTDQMTHNGVFTFDKMLKKIKTGIALSGFYSNYADGKVIFTGGALTISPKFKVGRGITFEPAATFAYGNKEVIANQNNYACFIEESRGKVLQLYPNGDIPTETNQNMPDIKIGGLLQHKKFWTAFTASNLMFTREKIYTTANPYTNKIGLRATVGTDYIHKPESGNVYSPQISLIRANGQTELWTGMSASFRSFIIGGSVTQRGDFMATTGIKLPAFTLLYQYDRTKSLAMQKTFGSHELTMRWTLRGRNSSQGILKDER